MKIKQNIINELIKLYKKIGSIFKKNYIKYIDISLCNFNK